MKKRFEKILSMVLSILIVVAIIPYTAVETSSVYDEGWYRPVDKAYWVLTDHYGKRARPTPGASMWHWGIDISTPSIPCKEVRATRSGYVIYVQTDKTLAWGNAIAIYHEDVNYTSLYMHMEYAPLFSKGAYVNQGDVIGYVGHTGESTWYHLDFRVYSGDGNPNNQWKDIETGRGTTIDPESLTYIDELDPYASKCTPVEKQCLVTTSPNKMSTGNSCPTFPLRKEPYETGAVISRIPEGTTLNIVGEIKNTKNNLWYRVKNGSGFGYIYSGNVTVLDGKYSVCSVKESKAVLRKAPTITSTSGTVSVNKNTVLNVYGVYTEIDSKFFSGTFDKKIKWYLVLYNNTYYYVDSNSVSGLSDKDAITVTAKAPAEKQKVNKGKGLDIGGTVSTAFGSLKKVTFGVFDSLGRMVQNASVTVDLSNKNVKSYDMSQMNNSIKFGSLPAGNYSYRVYVDGNQDKNLYYKANFEVVNSGGSNAPVYSNTGTPSSTKSKGVYVVTGGPLNYRTGPGTGYSTYGTIKNGVELEVTEVTSTDWGKTVYNGKTCWVALWETKYVREIETVKKPAAPVMMSAGTVDVAAGSTVEVVWARADYNAESYTLRMYNANGTEVTSKRQTGIKADYEGMSTQVVLDTAGSYYFTVEAVNSKYTSGSSGKSGTFVAHAPVNVKFADWNGNIIENKTVAWGTSATPAVPPTREGYTFQQWDKSYVNLKEDTVITAVYKINEYTVRFFSSEADRAANKCIGTPQKVKYGSAATAPVPNVPSGYTFVSWDKSFDRITGNTDVVAIYKWYNSNFSVYIDKNGTTAKRNDNGTGYDINFKMVNNGSVNTNCRIVVSIKTSKNKLVTTTESAAYYLLAGQSVSDSIFVPTTAAATTAEVYAIGAFSNTVPICQLVSVNINQNNTWHDWSTSLPPAGLTSQSRTEYRYMDLKTCTSSASSLAGWEKYDTKSAWGAYGSWSGWSATPVSGSDSRKVETKVDTKTETTGYNMVEYNTQGKDGSRQYRDFSIKNNLSAYGCNASYGEFSRSTSATVAQLNNAAKVAPGAYTSACSYPGINKSSKTGYVLNYGGYSFVFFQTTPITKTTNTTLYRYCDRSLVYTYYYRQWPSSWSSWSTTAVSASSTRKVETRTTYRYIANDSGSIEDNSGTPITINVSGYKNYAGKQAYLFVYKINEASDFTNEYTGQAVIDSNGNCSFTFIPREPLSLETGDYTAKLGIEGTTDTILLDTGTKLKAPVPTYTVTFVDDDDTVIQKTTVVEGDYAKLPETIPTKEGYTFIGWDYVAANVHSDITVKARYQKNQYSVVFIDWEKQTVTPKTFYYGDYLVAPEIENTDDSYAVGWEGVTEGMKVTSNMVITAKYEKKTYDVIFYDWDGNIVDKQTVEYGDAAEEPELPDDDDHFCTAWKSELDYSNVTEDVMVLPVYVFSKTVADPASSVKTGLYTEAQTVSLFCEDEDAVIYYTTNGTEPDAGCSIYTKPIVLNSSAVLKFKACAMGKNDSETVTEYLAINTGNGLSDWMSFDDLPDYVKSDLNEYGVISSEGYRYNDITVTSSLSTCLDLENDFWTFKGESLSNFSKWSKEYPEQPDDESYEIETRHVTSEDRNIYKYTRFKYYDENVQKYDYTYRELEGVTGEWENLTSEKQLTISAFDGSTPVYSNNGEKWFNQTKATQTFEVDYDEYRYAVKQFTYSKWLPWTEGEPDESDTREYETGAIFRYVAPERYIVTIVPTVESLGSKDNTFLNMGGTVADMNVEDYIIDGYDFLGFYKDAEYTEQWNIENDVVDANITLYPKYQIKSYSVEFIDYDGTVLLSGTFDYGAEIHAPSVDLREGYVFTGWDSEAYKFVDGDITLNACYVPEDEYITVTLDFDTYTMTSGSSVELHATVTPFNEETGGVHWSSSDESVVKVSDDGTITAVAEGSATISAQADVSESVAYCYVTVNANPAFELCLVAGSSFGIDSEGQLREIKANKNSVSEVKTQFINTELVVFDRNGNELSENSTVGTGAVIKLMNGETVADEMTVIMTGDMNGDGLINNRDAAMITRYLIAKETADFCQQCAIDVNGDGYINNRDAAMVSRYLVGKETL